MSGRIRNVLLLGIVMLAEPAGARENPPTFGAYALQFISPSARTLAMGEAAAGVVEDADAIWFDPAALAFTSSSAAVSYTHWEVLPDSDVNHDALAFSSRLDGIRGGIAGAVTYLDWGKQFVTDFSGNVLGEYRSYELAPALAFGSRLTEKIGVGVGFKVVRVHLVPATITPDGREIEATTAAADIACQLRPNSTTRVGICFQNLGPGLGFDDDHPPDPLPRNLKIGVAQQVFSGGGQHFLVAADLNKYLVRAEYEPILNLGAEHGVSWRDLRAAIRYGWIYEGWLYERDPINDPTYGLDLTFKGFSIDYANFPTGPERRNMFTFGASF